MKDKSKDWMEEFIQDIHLLIIKALEDIQIPIHKSYMQDGSMEEKTLQKVREFNMMTVK